MSQPFAEDVRIEARFLNLVNDSGIGGTAVGIIGTNPVPGQLGKIIFLTDAQASAMSDPAGTVLEGGLYQYVQFLSTATTAPAKGLFCFWSDYNNFVVTTDATAPLFGAKAGVILNAVTKGNYGWIQIAGRATCQFIATVTDTTIGDIVVLDPAPTGKVNAVADATGTLTYALIKSIVGTAAVAAANGGLKLVDLAITPFHAL